MKKKANKLVGIVLAIALPVVSILGNGCRAEKISYDEKTWGSITSLQKLERYKEHEGHLGKIGLIDMHDDDPIVEAYLDKKRQEYAIEYANKIKEIKEKYGEVEVLTLKQIKEIQERDRIERERKANKKWW